MLIDSPARTGPSWGQLYLLRESIQVPAHALLHCIQARQQLFRYLNLCVGFAAVAQQLQEYEVEVFGNSVTHAPLLNTPSGVAFGFGYPSPAPAGNAAPPLFSFSPTSNATSPTHFQFGSGSNPLGPSNFVFGAVRPDQPVNSSLVMDQSMDSS